MNKFVKYTLIAFGANIILFVLLLIPSFTCEGQNCVGAAIFGFLSIGLSLMIQLIVGLFLLSNESQKLIGQAMLLTVGFFLLIGFSICSIR